MAKYHSEKVNARIRRFTPRVWAFIDARHSPRSANGCIEWTGCCNRLGRAVSNKGVIVARAVLYRQTGVFGEVAMHDCDNPKCLSLEPGHLRWSTQQENIRDMFKKGRNTKANRTYPKGRAHWCAKLTENDLTAIRQERANGKLLREIAVQFGVSKTTIQNVCAASAPQGVQS